MENLKLFITGHKGFETLLFHEIRDILQSTPAKLEKRYGGIEIIGDIESVYRICLHSRLANRVFLSIAEKAIDDEDQLYKAVYAIDWSKHLDVAGSFAISATVSRSNLNHSQYVALKAKDALVDQFRERYGSRPEVDKNQPDIQIHINIHQNKASISLDLSGESLHRRGYRQQHSGAPLKEHLAAAMLMQAGWRFPQLQARRLFDPMCGSGTFAIEAAMIASNRAPGIKREYYGFNHWLQHDAKLWGEILNEAENNIIDNVSASIIACDFDATALEIAKSNAQRAGVLDLIEFNHQDIASCNLPPQLEPTIVICNPPYGQRLQSEQGLPSLYAELGAAVSQLAPATLCIISANPDLLHRLKLKRTTRKSIKNGPLECVLAEFETGRAAAAIVAPQDQPQSVDGPGEPLKEQPKSIDTARGQARSIDDPIAIPLLNRLRKNAKHMQRWARKNDINCYRIYDADLPEFSFALDYYQSEITPDHFWLHMQEYQAPKSIDADTAGYRISIAEDAVKQAFEIGEEQIFCKTRSRQRGDKQYQKQDNRNEYFQVKEGAASLLINLSDYLDSGLFLDHRIIRQRVFQWSKNKSVLNLFCYTGSVGVQAGLGGASQVTNVDMSASYLKWAEENHAINQLKGSRYQFIRADIVELLRAPSRHSIDRKFDMIFLDPPSFSNSSKMQQTLDVVRDHAQLIEQSMALLAVDGVLIFSTNKRSFKLSSSVSDQFEVEDISRATIPEDFKRRPGIHYCFEIREVKTK